MTYDAKVTYLRAAVQAIIRFARLGYMLSNEETTGTPICQKSSRKGNKQ